MPTSDYATAIFGEAAKLALADLDNDTEQTLDLMLDCQPEVVMWALLRLLRLNGVAVGGRDAYRRRLVALATAADLREIERDMPEEPER